MKINNIERSYIVHDENQILGFFGNYRFLSNFHQCPVYFEGLLYPSSENAYMAAKTLDVNQRREFQTIDPSEAKKLGRKIKLRPDWEDVKIETMLAICFDKFWRNKTIRQKLIDTGSAHLEETNHWGDTIWGTNESREGQNNLGIILMDIRKLFSSRQKLTNPSGFTI